MSQVQTILEPSEIARTRNLRKIWSVKTDPSKHRESGEREQVCTDSFKTQLHQLPSGYSSALWELSSWPFF